MSIWFRHPTLEDLNGVRDTLAYHLGIHITEIGSDFLVGAMPIQGRTKQKHGILHGGASVAFAETLASIGANLCVDPARSRCVGQEINANHVRSVSEGSVTGLARPLHLGSKSHVWGIEIKDDEQRLVCISRCTLFVIAVARQSPS